MVASRLVIFLVFGLFVAGAALAQQGGQGTMIQGGAVSAGHAPVAIQAQGPGANIYGDGGTALDGNFTELGITNTGTPFCINDSLRTAPGGYHQFCLGANALGGGLLSYNAYNGAAPLPFTCIINNLKIPNCLTASGSSAYLVNVLAFGATCLTGDSTAALNAALSSGASEVQIPCPINVGGAGSVTIGNGNVRLTGIGPIYYRGQSNAVWPPAAGPAINCTSTSVPCIVVASQGVEIDHLNLGNLQPAPPGSGTYTPTLYPFVITTSPSSQWIGLYLHDMTFTSASQCIDLEGTPNYSTVGLAGSQFTISNIWFNPCLNEGILLHLLDNTGEIDNVEYDFWWNRANPTVGAYVKAHSIGMTWRYAANTRLKGIEFFSNKIAIDQINDTVTYSAGVFKTLAAVNIQGTNISFNEVCQAMANESGTSLISTGMFSNVILYQDTSDPAVNCPLSSPIAIDLSASFGAHWVMSPLIVGDVQTVAAIGPNSTLHLDHVDVQNYSFFAPGANAFKVSAGADFSLGPSTFPGAVRPAAGAGSVLGPGLDATQGFAQAYCSGGGPDATEGAACLGGSGDSTHTGSVTFFTPDGSERGYTGAGTSAGINFKASGHLKSFTGNDFSSMSIGDDGSGHLIVNVNGLPVSCAGMVTGTLWDNAGVISVCP